MVACVASWWKIHMPRLGGGPSIHGGSNYPAKSMDRGSKYPGGPTILRHRIFDSQLRIKVMALWSFPICLYVESMRLQCFPPTLRQYALFRKLVLWGCRVWPWLFCVVSRHFFLPVLSKKIIIHKCFEICKASLSHGHAECPETRKMWEPDFWFTP